MLLNDRQPVDSAKHLPANGGRLERAFMVGDLTQGDALGYIIAALSGRNPPKSPLMNMDKGKLEG